MVILFNYQGSCDLFTVSTTAHLIYHSRLHLSSTFSTFLIHFFKQTLNCFEFLYNFSLLLLNCICCVCVVFSDVDYNTTTRSLCQQVFSLFSNLFLPACKTGSGTDKLTFIVNWPRKISTSVEFWTLPGHAYRWAETTVLHEAIPRAKRAFKITFRWSSVEGAAGKSRRRSQRRSPRTLPGCILKTFGLHHASGLHSKNFRTPPRFRIALYNMQKKNPITRIPSLILYISLYLQNCTQTFHLKPITISYPDRLVKPSTD